MEGVFCKRERREIEEQGRGLSVGELPALGSSPARWVLGAQRVGADGVVASPWTRGQAVHDCDTQRPHVGEDGGRRRTASTAAGFPWSGSPKNVRLGTAWPRRG
uniref:Uncharacterized protein n=1 Tax=Arundo donax TaxID=35708 RepID=A0A0A9I150_ARUDO